MPEEIVKRVRRTDETYDVIRQRDGKLVKRPLDAVAPKPAAAPKASETPSA